MNTQHGTTIVGSGAFSPKHAHTVILSTCLLILPAGESAVDIVLSSCWLLNQTM